MPTTITIEGSGGPVRRVVLEIEADAGAVARAFMHWQGLDPTSLAVEPTPAPRRRGRPPVKPLDVPTAPAPAPAVVPAAETYPCPVLCGKIKDQLQGLGFAWSGRKPIAALDEHGVEEEVTDYEKAATPAGRDGAMKALALAGWVRKPEAVYAGA